MIEKPDTSAEAMAHIVRWLGASDIPSRQEAAAQVRALAAERDEARARVRQLETCMSVRVGSWQGQVETELRESRAEAFEEAAEWCNRRGQAALHGVGDYEDHRSFAEVMRWCRDKAAEARQRAEGDAA